MMSRGLVLAAVLSAAVSGGAQAPLSVDTTFRVDLPAQNVFSVLPLPDGKLLISGNLEFDEFPAPPRAGERLLPNGQRDFSFNQGFLPMGGKLTPWADRYYSANGQGLRRFHYSGAIDTDFDFINQWQQISAMQGGDYHVFPDGRVLLGGYYDINDPQHGFDGGYNLAWLTSDGRLDTTRIHRTGNGAVFGLKEYPQGTAGSLGCKFLVHHWGTQYEGQPVSKVFRVHADGGLDESFDAPIEWGFALAMEPIADGRAYVGGLFRLENSPDTLQLVRLMPDGSLDPGFNNALHFEKAPGTYDIAPGVLCVYPIGPGLIAVTGNFNEVDDHPRGGICVLDTLGNVVDHYLDGAGCAAYDFPIGMTVHTYAIIQGVTRAPNGDYYIWGAYHGYSDGTTNDTLQRMVTRLHGGEIGLGVPQAEKPAPAMRVYPNPASGWVTLELDEMKPDTELVLRDALGRQLLQQRITGHYTTLQLQHLPDGCYNLELRCKDRRLAHERVIVQH